MEYIFSIQTVRSSGPRHLICLPSTRRSAITVTPLWKLRQAHVLSLNFRPKMTATRDKWSSVFWSSGAEVERTAMSSAYAVAFTVWPGRLIPEFLSGVAVRNKGSAARLKIVVLRASPWRTPANGAMVMVSFPTVKSIMLPAYMSDNIRFRVVRKRKGMKELEQNSVRRWSKRIAQVKPCDGDIPTYRRCLLHSCL